MTLFPHQALKIYQISFLTIKSYWSKWEERNCPFEIKNGSAEKNRNDN